MNNLKQIISRNLINIPGFRTNRKIIVFESDDWGMIRMASIEAQKDLKKKGYQIDQCPYNSNDRIESDADIQGLGEVLLSVKDSLGNPAKFTINNIVANPDFEKIRINSYENYYYKPFTETLKDNKDSQNVMRLYKEGINKNIFQPQLHGREHINLRLWLNRLQDGNVIATEAFNNKMYTIHKLGSISGRRDNLDAFGNQNILGDSYSYQQIIKEAQEIFSDTWGFKSKSFIAPCYVWHPSIEPLLQNEGIKYIQGSYVQQIPVDNTTFNIKKKYHYMGQKNAFGQRYLIRNCAFEPTESRKNNVVENALKDIELSFLYNKPAIIGTHRLNYIGSLNVENRIQNLNLLEELLKNIIRIWPDVEFLSSDQLGELMSKKK